VEALLAQLLEPSTERIRQVRGLGRGTPLGRFADHGRRGPWAVKATERLTVYFSKNAILLVLGELLTRAAEWPVRQLAAVLLRQRLAIKWRRLAVAVKTHMKAMLLHAVVHEPKHVSPSHTHIHIHHHYNHQHSPLSSLLHPPGARVGRLLLTSRHVDRWCSTRWRR
jgi:hypothetical protein